MKYLFVALLFLCCVAGTVCGQKPDSDATQPAAAKRAEQDVYSRLDAALDEYNATVQSELDSLMKRINEAFQKATKSGDLETAKKTQAAENKLRELGEVPDDESMRRITDPARRVIARAGKTLQAKYELASKEILRSGRVEEAEAVLKEAADIIGRGNGGSLGSPRVNAGDKAALPRVSRNSIGMELRLIPAGTFWMGDEADGTKHRVTISKPFYLGTSEVTNAQWLRLMGNIPGCWREPGLPVAGVSWEDASEFCRRLSALRLEVMSGRAYRLPTEAEWEYACRAGTTTRWSFGDDSALGGDFGWYAANAGGQTRPCAFKKPNAWGLHDMHGNVWEWVNDWLYDYPKGDTTDPNGPTSGKHRVIRGGSHEAPELVRCAFRGLALPTHRDFCNVGLRVAMTPAEPKAK